MKKYLPFADTSVIVITIVLFVIALFTKGFTHDLLLEVGVLLVSIKIILMNYKNISANKSILKELKDIKESLSEQKDKSSN